MKEGLIEIGAPACGCIVWQEGRLVHLRPCPAKCPVESGVEEFVRLHPQFGVMLHGV